MRLRLAVQLLLMLLNDSSVLRSRLNDLLLLLNGVVGRLRLDGLRNDVRCWTHHAPVLWGHGWLRCWGSVGAWCHGLGRHGLRSNSLSWMLQLLLLVTLLLRLLLHSPYHRSIWLIEIHLLLALAEVLRIV